MMCTVFLILKRDSMASISRKKKFDEQSVYDAALDRVRRIYDIYDKVAVSFSGGKDSTAVLHLASVVAAERGIEAVDVIFFDEECLPPPTVEYVARVANRADINLYWYCLPVKHRNACSNDEPFWHCWEPAKKDVWVRDPPPKGIFDHPRWIYGLEYQYWSPLHFLPAEGNTIFLTGIRAQESFRRLKMVTSRTEDSYITETPATVKLSEAEQIKQFVEKVDAFSTYDYNASDGLVSIRTTTLTAHPIYDWDSFDVWRVVEKFGLDYNRTYNDQDKTSLHGKYLSQRISAPFGEEPVRGLSFFKEAYPELFDKMILRVKGVNTALRYANTELYSRKLNTPPDGMTWKDWLPEIIKNHGDLSRTVAEAVNALIKSHYRQSILPLEEEKADPVSGCSWKFLCKVALRGDFKRRTGQVMNNNAVTTRGHMGINLVEAIDRYGTPKHKAKHLEDFKRIGIERGEPIP